MKLRTLFFACFCCFVAAGYSQISFSPTVASFASVFQGAAMTSTVTLNNNTSTDLVVQDIDFYHTDAFTITDTAFVIAAGGNRVLTITCDPGQNVNYDDWMMVKSSSHPEVPHVRVSAIGKYSDTYWDATQNLWNEDLKAALTTTITTGMILTRTYNEARDQMYMVIDNQRLNGQGASQNTLECVYTGFLAVGYTSRTDAQTTFNLNTEHTMPQSLFNSNLPELSDLHHIFVTTAPANTERGNKPFGPVANPSWTQGGSKSNSTTFEPRDEQKGASIRALLYFLFRYQDYQGFICGMEATLRSWHNQYPPDAVEKKRDDDIFSYQHNRNPFVAHPEFMDRIASLCGADNGNQDPIADREVDSLNFGSVASGATLDGYYAIANQGIDTLHLSNLTLSSPEFTFPGATTFAIPKDSIALIPIRFSPTAANQSYSAQLTFTTDDPTAASVTVFLMGNSNLTAVENPALATDLLVWPVPAKTHVWLQIPYVVRKATTVELWNLTGQLLRTTTMPKGEKSCKLNVDGLPYGIYLLRLATEKGILTQKLTVE